jgi:hypothetical protein
VCLHVRLAQADKAIGESGLEFGDLSKFRNGNVELTLFVSRRSSLHMLDGFRRQILPGKPQE